MFREDEHLVVGQPSVPAKVGKWHALAKAIRAGCKLRPVQCFGSLFAYGPDASCAIGAAIEALGGVDYGAGIEQPDLRDFGGRCPIGCNCDLLRNENIIPHLNDHHRWSREKISDWLDTL